MSTLREFFTVLFTPVNRRLLRTLYEVVTEGGTTVLPVSGLSWFTNVITRSAGKRCYLNVGIG